jgi:hypothetical protein
MGEQEDGGGKVRRAELRLLVERTVKLAFAQLRLDRTSDSGRVEEIIRRADRGEFDAAIDAHGPPAQPPRRPRRFDEQGEFSEEAWQRKQQE